MTKGQIRQSLSGYYDVVTTDGIEYRTRAREIFVKKANSASGDWVEFKAQKADEGYILEIYPRKNQLVRPPMANLDTAIVVTACIQPDFSSNLLDRQLAMLEAMMSHQFCISQNMIFSLKKRKQNLIRS